MSDRTSGTHQVDPVERFTDPSLILAHGADVPDPADPAEPAGLPDKLKGLMDKRATRRWVISRGAAGVGVGALASSLAGFSTAPAEAHGLHDGGDLESLNDAIDVDYLRRVTERVASFGDTPMGFRPGGSPADLAAVDWIAREMRATGMRRVAKLPVPIDRWVFNGASVAIDEGPSFEASSWGGVPGTAAAGIHAEVVDVGTGFEVDYEGLDVVGKIVMVDWQFGDFWVNRHGHQATLEGAAAVIFYTGRTAAGAFYNKRDDGLLGFDGTYDDDWVPFVFISRDSANDLLDRIAAGTTTITLTSKVALTRAQDGGVGYNVLGMIPGTDLAHEYIIFTGHHDAWFQGAADDATAIAAMLGIAKAVKDSRFRPRRTLLFLASTNEEYGYTDAYYEWLIGCWYAVTHQRPDWQHKAVLTLDFELLGTGDPGERLLIRTHSELLDLAVSKLEADPSRTPFGTAWSNVVWANADHFTLTAAGIPGLYFNTVGTQYLTRNYHTNFDIPSNVNIPYLAQNIEVINDIWTAHDRSTLPSLDFVARATEAESRIAYQAEPGVGIRDLPGADQRAQDALERSVANFRAAAESLDTRIEGGSVRSKGRVGRKMMDAERGILKGLVALDVFDQYVFPHQQPQRDATRLQLAIDALLAGDPVLANETYVRRTSLTNAGRHFAYESYAAELERHEPRSDRLQWGAQAHLAPYVDVWQEYRSIAAKITAGVTAPAGFADEVASLTSKLNAVYERLNERLVSMTAVFDSATSMLKAAVRAAG
ncbi:MAG: M28 family peptidase [Actinomycetota bacterium]